MAKPKLRFEGGRWRDAGGRFVSARKVAPVVKAPPRTVRVTEAAPRRWVRVNVNIRYRVGDRVLEAQRVRVLKDPSKARERKTVAAMKKQLHRDINKEARHKKFGRAAAGVAGHEVERLSRYEKPPKPKIGWRDAPRKKPKHKRDGDVEHARDAK